MAYKEIFQGGRSVGEVIGVGNRALVEYCGKDAHNKHSWRWSCGTCGSERGPDTIPNIEKSSSCRACYGRRVSSRGSGYMEISGTLLSKYRSSAKKRNLAWEIDGEYLWAIWLNQGGLCVYSGVQLVHRRPGHLERRPIEDRGTASIDRIDPFRGYVPGNVQWVHRDINYMKWQHPEERFLQLCQAVAAHRPPSLDCPPDWADPTRIR